MTEPVHVPSAQSPTSSYEHTTTTTTITTTTTTTQPTTSGVDPYHHGMCNENYLISVLYFRSLACTITLMYHITGILTLNFMK